MRYLIFPTSLGWMGVSGTHTGLRHLVLPCASAKEVEQRLFRGNKLTGNGAENNKNPALLELARRLNLYFEGCKVSFPDEVDLAEATPFHREVWLAIRDIPYGQTMSYSELAAKLSKPQAVRAIGQALSRNPLPIILPCHRVIGRNGKLTGYAGGIELKKRLLEIEAVNVHK